MLLAIRNVSWQALWSTLASVNLLYIIPAGFCSLVGYLLRTVRWKRILSPTKQLASIELFPILILGFAANNVLPARIGELVRAHRIGRRAGISRALCLTTIVVERVFDGLTLLLFLGLVLLVTPAKLGTNEVEILIAIGSVVFVGAAIGFGVILIWEDLGRRLVRFLLSPLPARFTSRVASLADSLFAGLQALRRSHDLAIITLLSLLVWLAEALGLYLIVSAFSTDLAPGPRLLAAAFTLVFVNLGIMLPSAPGYVGTFHFFARVALMAFGLTGAMALSIGIVSHAVQYVLVTGLGLVFFVQDQLAAGRSQHRTVLGEGTSRR